MHLDNQKISRTTGKPKVSHGGSRPGGGRPRRMEEHEIIERLSPMHAIAIEALEHCLLNKDIKAVQIFFQYFYGLPTQRIESKIEATLNSVSVEVITPHELVKIA
jgi:hypothetical protein